MYSTTKKRFKPMRDTGYLVVWLLYMFYRYTVVLYTVTFVKESTFYTDHEVFEAICVKNLVSVVFLQLLHSRAQSMWLGFVSNRAGKDRAWFTKRTNSICFVVQVVQSVEKPGGTVVGFFKRLKKEK